MRWFRSTVQGSGFARFGTGYVFLILLSIAVAVGLAVHTAFSVYPLSIFLSIGVLSFELEVLSALAARRRRELAKLWPEVLDSIYSAVSSGLTLLDAFDDLALKGPVRLRNSFDRLSQRLDKGWSMADALDALKAELGQTHADRLCEILRVVSITGTESLGSSLRAQSGQIRNELSVLGQIESKQSWVAGTAKLAVVAPWVIVAMLSMRGENADLYNSAGGAMVLFIGFIVSIFAYRLVHLLGVLPSQPRVWSS